jgi:O-antigen ligase
MYALARLETADRRQIWAFSALFAYCAFGILLGFSRGSWINFAVAMSLFMIVRLATQRQRLLRQRMLRITAAALIGGAVLIAGLASTDKVQAMLDQRLKVVQYYDMGEHGRLTNQLAIVKAVAVTPLGIGPGQSEQDYFFDMAPHNLYLHVLIESGWIGGLAFIFFAALTLWRGRRFLHRSANVDAIHIASYACVIGVLAQSFFVDSTHWRHFFLLIAMVWGPLLAWENGLAQRHSQAYQAAVSRHTRADGLA